MEKNKLSLILFVADKLAAAPEGSAKTDLVEELSDNLYQRYLDLVASGVEEGEALQRAKEDLGDTAELVDYLKGLSPEEQLPPPTDRPRSAAEINLEGILQDVEEIARAAVKKAESAVREAKAAIEESGILEWEWKSDSGDVEYRQSVQDAEFEVTEEPKQDGESENSSGGWGFGINLDTDRGEFFAGGGPVKENKVYGVGYDKAKGGFFAQWGDYRGGEPLIPEQPIPSDVLRAIDVQVDGEVTVVMDQDPAGDVVIDGDVEDLEVKRTEDGVLVIRQGRTASSSFMFRRGLSSADVRLSLPDRAWDLLRICSNHGDVVVSGDQPVKQAVIRSISGDVSVELPDCQSLELRTTSGDIRWEGNCRQGGAFTVSGDVRLTGDVGAIQAKSVSGDVEVEGSLESLRCATVSGDVRLESSKLPEAMDLTTGSGDCILRIPDSGPFEVHFKTGSGDFTSDFFRGHMASRSNTFTYQGGGQRRYAITTGNGDVELLTY